METKQITFRTGETICCHHEQGSGPGFLVVGGYGVVGAIGKSLGQTMVLYARSRGQDCVVIDFRGQGASDGERNHMTVPGMRDDILAVAAELGLHGRIGIGASLGGWAMLAAQQENPDLLWGMIALAPAVNWDLSYFSARIEDKTLRASVEGLVAVEGESFLVSMDFFETAQDARLEPRRIRMDGGLHILQGADDRVATPQATAMMAADIGATTETRMHIIPHIDHKLASLQGKELQFRLLLACKQILVDHARAEHLAAAGSPA